jgi:hypothetical protein
MMWGQGTRLELTLGASMYFGLNKGPILQPGLKQNFKGRFYVRVKTKLNKESFIVFWV